MRLIQTRVPVERREEILATLDRENIEHIVAEEGGDSDAMILYFPLPDGAVRKVLEELYEVGLDEDAFTVITDIESATTPTFKDLESQYTQGPDDEVGLSHASLRSNAREVTPGRAMFVVFAALSAIVAVSGLMLNSAIVIVGAMVISPFAGSSLSASVGWVIGDPQSVLDSFKSQLLGLVVATGSATVAAAFIRWAHLVPNSLAIENISQVSAFSIPIVLTFVIAIFAGAAGALALASDLSVSLAGVAVAAAIVPAAAAVGLGVVWAKPLLVLGAVVLLLMNLLLINVSAFLALTAFGYRGSADAPLRSYVEFDLRTVGYALVGLVVLLALLGSVFSTYQYLMFVETVNQNVDTVVEEERYSDLELIETQTDYGAKFVMGPDTPETVQVTVGRSTDREYAELSNALRREIAQDTTRRVTVKVRFVDYQQATPGSRAADRRPSAASGATRPESLRSRLVSPRSPTP
jgi:uncharacterized hydrophobic protein (TIGR00341 family)